MPLIPLLIGSSTALGVGYFCADVYRNRRRLSEKPVLETDLICYEIGLPDQVDFRVAEQTLNHAGHAIGEVSSECASGDIGHCVEAIAPSLMHELFKSAIASDEIRNRTLNQQTGCC